MEIKQKKEIIITLTEKEARDINLALGNTIAKIQSLTEENVNMPTVLIDLQNAISDSI